VDDVIEKDKKGYDTRVKAVEDAIRQFLEQLEA
jgi:metal-responsive CopG/Arc/MetJ family transcriptional regulator